MSNRKDNRFRIEKEKPQQCDLCGAIAELRPYGPNGEAICFDCGMANPEATEAAFLRAVAGVDSVEIVVKGPAR